MPGIIREVASDLGTHLVGPQFAQGGAHRQFASLPLLRSREIK